MKILIVIIFLALSDWALVVLFRQLWRSRAATGSWIAFGVLVACGIALCLPGVLYFTSVRPVSKSTFYSPTRLPLRINLQAPARGVYSRTPFDDAVLEEGKPFKIMWGIDPAPPSDRTIVKIEIVSLDGTISELVADGVAPMGGPYNWFVRRPAGAAASQRYVLTFKFYDSSYFNDTLRSGEFEIVSRK